MTEIFREILREGTFDNTGLWYHYTNKESKKSKSKKEEIAKDDYSEGDDPEFMKFFEEELDDEDI
jgi:hypothetical protein